MVKFRYILISLFALAYSTITSQVVDWKDLELCPKVLISEADTTISFGSCNFGNERFRVFKGSQITLRNETKTTRLIGPGLEVSSCICSYQIAPDQYQLFATCPDPEQEITEGKDTIAFFGSQLFHFYWLDRYDQISEEECIRFNEQFGTSGSEFTATRKNWVGSGNVSSENDEFQVEVSGSNKLALGIFRRSFFFDNTNPETSSPHRVLSLEAMQSAAANSFNLLEAERAIDNACIQTIPLVGLDYLLIKNRWPTPGDRIDSIVYGQFLDSLPPPPFMVRHSLSLSIDHDLDQSDQEFFSKVFQHPDFRKLDATMFPALNKDTYFSNDWISLYVDDPGIDQNGDLLNFSSQENGIYHLIFKTDSDEAIIECDEANNYSTGVWIEIDSFQAGDCNACLPSITDNQGLTWNLVNNLPDCLLCSERYPPTSGKAYYDGESYLASCVYDREGQDPVALAWLRWQQNKLAKDSVTYLNDSDEEVTFLKFCELSDFEDEFGSEVIPDLSKVCIGAFGNPAFDSEVTEMMLSGLIECYLERAISLDTLCRSNPQGVLLDRDSIYFNVNNLQADTVLITTRGAGELVIEGFDVTGDLDLDISTPVAFPIMLTNDDTLPVIILPSQNQGLNELKSAEVEFTGSIGGTALSLYVGLIKPQLIIDNFFASIDPSSDQDTLYAGETNVFRCRLIDEFNGKPLNHSDTIRIKAQGIMDQSSPGIELIDEVFLVVNGSSEGKQYNAFKGQFGAGIDIGDSDFLSGKTKIRFFPLINPDFSEQEVDLVYAYPFDFILESIEYQQGIVHQHNPVTLGNQTFDSLPFIIKHRGHILLNINFVNKSLIDYDKFEFSDLKANIMITKGDATPQSFEINDIKINDHNGLSKGSLTEQDYTLQELFRMEHVFDQAIDISVFPTVGNYHVTGEILFSDQLIIEKSKDRYNNRNARDLAFVASKGLNILVYSAAIPGETEHPEVSLSDVFDFLRSTYPMQEDKLILTNGGKWDVQKESTFGKTRSKLKERAKAELIAYNAKNTLKADLIAVMGDSGFIDYIANGAAGISWHTDRVAMFDAAIPQTTSHEIGHILDLGDTYAGGAEELSINPPKRIIPLGNIVEAGNIHLLNENQLQDYNENNYAAERALYDFMGNVALRGDRIRDTWMDRLTWSYLYNQHFKLDPGSRSAEQYLLVSGTVSKDHDIRLDPMVVLDNPPFVSENNPLGEYVIIFSGEDGTTALEHRFDIDFIVFEVGPVDTVGFLFYLPYDEIYKNLEIEFRDSLLFSFQISPNTPEITRFAGTFMTETVSFDFDWSATDADQDTLYYTLHYLDETGQYWPIESQTPDSHFVWATFNQPWFDPQSGAVVLTASDGFNEDTAQIAIPMSGLVGNHNLDEQGIEIQALPNPFSDLLNLQIEARRNMFLNIEILNVSGSIIHSDNYEIGTGTQSFIFNAETWPPGLLFIRLTDLQSGSYLAIKAMRFDR